MTTYRVQVTREGRSWMIEIPALEEFGGLTQARHLADVEAHARSYIAVSLDVPMDSFEVEVERDDYGTGEDVTAEEAPGSEVSRGALRELLRRIGKGEIDVCAAIPDFLSVLRTTDPDRPPGDLTVEQRELRALDDAYAADYGDTFTEVAAAHDAGDLTDRQFSILHTAAMSLAGSSGVLAEPEGPLDYSDIEPPDGYEDVPPEVTHNGSRDGTNSDVLEAGADHSVRFFASNDNEGRPLWLLRWSADGLDITVWSQSRTGWFPAWANAIDEVHDLTREHGTEPVTAEEAERLKNQVEDPSDEILAHWAVSVQTPRGQRWGAT